MASSRIPRPLARLTLAAVPVTILITLAVLARALAGPLGGSRGVAAAIVLTAVFVTCGLVFAPRRRTQSLPRPADTGLPVRSRNTPEPAGLPH